MADETTKETPTEPTQEQKDIIEHGRQSSDATKPDPLKEGKDEEFGTPADKTKDKPEASKKDGKEEAGKEPDKEQVEEEEKDDSWKDQYVELDHPSGQAAINLLKEAKVSPVEANDIFAEAIKTNDLNKVDWARLEKLVGADKALLIKSGVTQYYNEKYSASKETEKFAYDEFGGKDKWAEVVTHFKKAEAKDPALKRKLDGIRKSIDLNGYAAEVALKELKNMYNADPNTKGTGVSNQTRGQKPSQEQPSGLSKEDYRKELDKLGPNPRSEQVDALRARRRIALAAEMGK